MLTDDYYRYAAVLKMTNIPVGFYWQASSKLLKLVEISKTSFIFNIDRYIA
jgi:hypothetical protein